MNLSQTWRKIQDDRFLLASLMTTALENKMKEEILLETIAAIAEKCTPEKVTRLERIVCALIKSPTLNSTMLSKELVKVARAVEKEMMAPDKYETAIRELMVLANSGESDLRAIDQILKRFPELE